MAELVPYETQRAAIEAPVGPTLVLAGPGAGKTFCLIRRIEHLVDKERADPARICAVTFTNKAAEEVALRLHRALGVESQHIACGTLHSLCLGILREHAEAAGLRRGFGVADEDYQHLLLIRIGVRDRRERERLLRVFGLRRLAGVELADRDEPIFDTYLSILREKNLLDFDGLIGLTADLFHRSPERAREIAARWDHVLVDEFQDLDPSQYAIIKRLAEDHRSLFVVGDEEQSIFGWRGSDLRLLWRFRTDFGAEDPIVLDRNCRSSRQIFTAARRLMTENPNLFEKEIHAERESEFEVEAYEFEDDAEESRWIANHLIAVRLSGHLGWGDFAVLYRRHATGRRLEDRLIAAGIPCRLARGQSLLDDPVIAYVIASLRLMTAPDDPLAVEAFAERMLPRTFMNQMRTWARREGLELLPALRRFAQTMPKQHPDRRKAWRFIYHVENLRGLYRSHDTLIGLVEALLSERVRRYGNALEEHHDELSDPVGYPGAEPLAGTIKDAVSRGAPIKLEPMRGVEIALKGMLLAAEVPCTVEYGAARESRAGDVTLTRDSCPSAATLFKALQLIHSHEFSEPFTDYVTFDLETTDRDPRACEVIEVGAARVRDGAIVDTFHSLVRPDGSISARATEIHGYTDEDVADAPTLEEVWPEFKRFVGDDVLVAHNGHGFDIPVLRRTVSSFAVLGDLVFFDTLPLARSLFAGDAKLGALAERFDIELPRSHHAADDARALVGVFEALSRLKLIRARKASLANTLDYLALGIVLDREREASAEEELLVELARPYALGRFSNCLDFYASERKAAPAIGAPAAEAVIEGLGGAELMTRIRAEKRPAERYPAAFARLRALVEASESTSLETSVEALLERVALSSSEGVEADPHRVNLLTLHAAKGLEFPHVYIAGVEDYEIPGYHSLEHGTLSEIQEARRLLYVGMTRARERLILTRVARRRGKLAGGNMFLEEIGVVPTPVGTAISDS